MNVLGCDNGDRLGTRTFPSVALLRTVEPPVVIGLPIYNGERFVEEAITSLLGQTYSDFHLHIADNASTDDTEGICRAAAETDKRIHYLRRESNLGAIDNHNLLVTDTSSELFMWAGADDVHDPTRLQRCVEALTSEPDAVLAFTSARLIDTTGAILRIWHSSCRFADPDPTVRLRDALAELDPSRYIYGLMRRQALTQTELQSPIRRGDGVLIAALSVIGRFAEVREPLLGQRWHESRLSNVSARDWYHQVAPDGRIRLPNVEEGYWYARAISRVPLSPMQRLRLLRATAPWLKANAIPMAKNVARAGITLSERAVESVRSRG